MRLTRALKLLGCCQARSALSKTHTGAFQLVRTAEIRPRDGFEGCAAVFVLDLCIQYGRVLCDLASTSVRDEKKVFERKVEANALLDVCKTHDNCKDDGKFQ